MCVFLFNDYENIDRNMFFKLKKVGPEGTKQH